MEERHVARAAGAALSWAHVPTTAELTCLRQLEHWTIYVGIDQRLVRLVRTHAPLESVASVEASFADVAEIVGKFPTRSWGLVQDMRNARPAPSLEIERAIRANRQAITALFERHALLFATAMGVMQAKRMLREVPEPKIEIFTDVGEAFARATGRATPSTRDSGVRRAIR